MASVMLSDVRNSKGNAFDLQDPVQYGRAVLYAAKELGVPEAMSLYPVCVYLAHDKTVSEGYVWFEQWLNSLEATLTFHAEDAQALKAGMESAKAQAKAGRAAQKASAKAAVQAGEKRPLQVGTTVRMSVTKSGTVTLKGAEKSTLTNVQKGKLADLAHAIKQMSAEEREYLQALLA